MTARQMLCGTAAYGRFQTERSLINRRLLNLLSSTRGYIDQMSRIAGNLEAKTSKSTIGIKTKFSERYDLSLGYRVMEALRNYTQHCGLPIDFLTYHSKRVAGNDRTQLRFYVAIHASRSELAKDGKFKKKVLKELESHGDSIDLKLMLRDYVADLAVVHEWFRSKTVKCKTTWEEKYESAIQRFAKAYPQALSLKGLAAVAEDPSTRTDEVNLFPEFIENQRELVKKNSGAALKQLGILCVSGESAENDA